MRAIRRLLTGKIVSEYNRRLLAEAHIHRAQLLFVFKGALVTSCTLRALRDMDCVTIQFYPDVSFRTHGRHIPEALKEYDWIFTTKNFGLHDMNEQLGVTKASFLPHAYDPETHKPVEASAEEAEFFGADISFVGNWSPKKQKLMQHVDRNFPIRTTAIWGPKKWEVLQSIYRGQPVLGLEYAKAIRCSKINIAILSERRFGASHGDNITARTFEIPAVGGFMLHEWTREAEEYFAGGRECAYFTDADDLVRKIQYYLDRDEERQVIAAAGHQRALVSGYSADDRIRAILDKYWQVRAK